MVDDQGTNNMSEDRRDSFIELGNRSISKGEVSLSSSVLKAAKRHVKKFSVEEKLKMKVEQNKNDNFIRN